MSMTRITVIGAGNGGVTAAYHFSRMGHEVCLFDTEEFGAQVKAVQAAGGIRAEEEHLGDPLLLPGFQKVAKATTDPEEALSFADNLVMICPSYAQEPLFERILPFLREEHLLLTMPGNFAALVLKKKLEESERAGLSLTFADSISIPWATRLNGPATVDIMGLKEFLPVSLYPKEKRTKENEERIREILPIPPEFLRSPLEAGLENINFGGHPLMTTVNIGLLENFPGHFTYYADCCSPATARAADRMDKERLAVGKAYGYQLRTELEAMNALYASHAKSVYEFNRGSVTHGKVKSAPSKSTDRYISEDVPYLLVPIAELAHAAGQHPVIMESVIHLAEAYNDADYFAEGRTLEKMGLAGLKPEEIRERV